MTKKYVLLSQIQCDVKVRTHVDIDWLREEIERHGLETPLLVEGPDEKGIYFIVKGFRRYCALQQLRKQPMLVHVEVLGPVTNTLKRNIKRFSHLRGMTKPTGIDLEFLFEEIKEQGEFTKEQLCAELNLDMSTVNKMLDGIAIPKGKRENVAKDRRSAGALKILDKLDVPPSKKEDLYRQLINKNFRFIDAKAIERVTKRSIYQLLTERQQIDVVDKTKRTHEFHNQEAHELILKELMMNNPEQHEELIQEWGEMLIRLLSEIEQYIHPELKNLLRTEHCHTIKDWIQLLQRKMQNNDPNTQTPANNQARYVIYQHNQTAKGMKYRLRPELR